MLHIEPGKELTSFARPVSGRMREGSAILVLYSVDDLSCEGYNAWIGNALFPMPESSGGNRSGPTLQENHSVKFGRYIHALQPSAP